MAKITKSRVVRAGTGDIVPADSYGNNIAVACPNCSHPVLLVTWSQRRGSHREKPSPCPQCETKIWIESDLEVEQQVDPVEIDFTPRAPALGDRFGEALSVAFKLHRHQARKTSEDEPDAPRVPYIAHLMSVAALVLEHGGDEEEAIAALLHDGPEDQGGQKTLDDIRRRFGNHVADIVKDCSDTFDTPKPAWRARKERYLDHLRQATSPSVFLVSVADKVYNLRSIRDDYQRIGEGIWKRFTGGKDGSLWYYGALLKVYQDKAPDRCAELVRQMERLYQEVVALASGETRSTDGGLQR